MTGVLEIFQEAIATQIGQQLWNIYFGLAVAIGGALTALGWALGELTAAPAVKSWARDELKEFVRTLAILALLFAGLPILHSLSVVLVGDAPFAYPRAFLASMHVQLSNLFFYFTGLFWGWIPVTGLALPVAIPIPKPPFIILVPGAYFGYGTAYGYVLDLIQFAFTPLATAMFAVIALGQMLDFVEAVALPFVLPLGIALRAFPFTRRTGSTLVALAITAYVALPVSVALSAIVWHGASETLAFEALQAGIMLSSEDIPIVGATTSIIRHFPPLEKIILYQTDALQWEILSHDGTWRIWREGCIDCTKPCTPPERQQPPDDCDCWTMVGVGLGGVVTPIGCYKKVASGTFVAGEIIEFPLKGLKNRAYTFIIDAHERNLSYVEPTPGPGGIIWEVEGQKWIPIGFDIVTFQLGNPCEGLLNQIACALGIVQSIEEKERITPKFDVRGFMKGAIEPYKELVDNPQYLIAPPFAASLVIYEIVEKLPYLMLPVAIVIISLVMTIMIVMSTYRGLSEALGGEPTLLGIGKVL